MFDRSRHGVSLTPAGRALDTAAKAVIAEMGQFEYAVRDIAGDRARVALGTSPTLVEPFLVTELARHAHRGDPERPRVVPTIAMANSDDVRDDVRHGRVHLGLAASAPGPEVAFGARELGELPLMKDEVVVAVGPDHEWAARKARGKRVYLEEVVTEPMAARDAGSNVRLVFDAALRKRGLELADPIVEVGVGRLVIEEAQTRGCPALLSRVALRDHPEMTIIDMYEETRRGPRRVRVPRYFKIVFLDWERLTPEARDLAEFLQAAGPRYMRRSERRR